MYTLCSSLCSLGVMCNISLKVLLWQVGVVFNETIKQGFNARTERIMGRLASLVLWFYGYTTLPAVCINETLRILIWVWEIVMTNTNYQTIGTVLFYYIFCILSQIMVALEILALTYVWLLPTGDFIQGPHI